MYWISILVVWNILWFIVYYLCNVEFSWRTLAAPLLLYIIFHALDLHSTYLCVLQGGARGEENRFLAFLAHFFSESFFMTVVIANKIIIFFVFLPLLITFCKFRYTYATLISSNFMFVFVVSGNYYAYYKMAYP